MKRSCLLSCLLLMAVVGQSQTIVQGLVTDKENLPVFFANVVLLKASAPSNVLLGTTTGEDGTFLLALPDGIHPKEALLAVSFVGFERDTLKLAGIQDLRNLQIVLRTNDQLLKAVIVKHTKDFYKVNGSTITADIDGTPLGKLGRLDDMMNFLPFVSGRDGNYSVWGRGTAMVYLNGRRVYDISQLRNLFPGDIRKVEVLTNPGAQYTAETRAVIRITTKPRAGEGIGGTVYAYALQGHKLSDVEDASLAYNKGKWEVTGGVSLNHTRMKMDVTESTRRIDDDLLTEDQTAIDYHSQYYSGKLGVNYQPKAGSNLGFYTSLGTGKQLNDMASRLRHLTQGVEDFNSPTAGESEHRPSSWRTNLYYNLKVGKTELTFSDDIFAGKRRNIFSYNEAETDATVSTDGAIRYFMNTLIANATTPFSASNARLSYGFETTFSGNRQSFGYEEQAIATGLQATKNKTEQWLGALYAEYARRLGKVSLDAGLRYEYIKQDYYQNGVFNANASERYGYLFPTLNLSVQTGGNYLSFGYKYIIRRPGYSLLNDNIQYNSRYSYVQGNSLLKPARQHIFSYLLSFGKVRFIGSYNLYTNSSRRISQPYGVDKVLARTENIKRHQDLSLGAFWSDRLGWYTPTVNMGYSQPFFSIRAADGTNQSYNKPSFSGSLNNTFSLKGDITLTARFAYQSRSYSYFTRRQGQATATFSASKSFRNGLFIELSANELLRSHKHAVSEYTYNGIYEYSSQNNDTRNVSLMLSYSFNYRPKRFTNRLKSTELNRF